MKLLEVRATLIKRVAISAVMLILTLAAYYYIENYRITMAEKEAKVQRNVSNLNSQITEFDRKYKEFKEASKLWEKLNNTQKKRAGLQINTVQDFLEELKQEYKIIELNVNMSKPEELKDSYRTTTTVVVSSIVEINFRAISDEYVLSFISTLMNDLPGYVKVLSFRINRENELTPEMLQQLQKGTLVPLINGDIRLQWRDLKDITKKKEVAPPAPPPAATPAPTVTPSAPDSVTPPPAPGGAQ